MIVIMNPIQISTVIFMGNEKYSSIQLIPPICSIFM